MKEQNKLIIQIVIGFLGVVAGLLGLQAFNQYLLMGLPLIWRMVIMIAVYYPIALAPFCIAKVNKDRWSDFGFSKEKLGHQAMIGLLIAACMSFVFTVIPHLAGRSDWVNNNHRYSYIWQFLYDFVYYILAVGLVEEFVFRGFFYKKFNTLFGSTTGAVIGSSVLFGLFHFLGGNILQILGTGILGVIWCICKLKIKHCTLLSLIIAHGVYDALITVWLYVFT